ncbi:GNAT family N-acetyltransferase [Acetoanaerobium sticklandii]|uniref:GNAT family N-acetyltransferase n=1 Tax=Acetoanaerobium sticklandii TaxID=1511 RepID=UPI003A916D6E
MFSIKVDEKIELHLLQMSDAEDFFRLIEINRRYLQPFMPRISETQSIVEAKEVINLFNTQYTNNNGFRAGIYFESQLIGIAGFKGIDWRNRKTEIMYWIDGLYSGKGIVTSCVLKLVSFAFEVLDLNKVIVKSSVNNLASNRVAVKCGFVHEATLKQEELLDSGFSDINVYYITKKL